MDSDEMLTIEEACIEVGGRKKPIHPATLWRWVKAGKISPPIKMGPGTARFSRNRLRADIERAAEVRA